MRNRFKAKFICLECGSEYPLNLPIWKCECGSTLDIEFEKKVKLKKIHKKRFSIWRYRDVLPVESDDNIVSLEEGFTPLLKMEIFKKNIFLKLDFLFPTGSFKDRGASVLVSKLRELRIKRVVEDSSGNAGCSISAYCAKAGVSCEIFVPERVSLSKLAQIKMYGANVNLVKGKREDVAKSALLSAENSYYASHVWNPFFFQGTKTFSYEMWEQLDFRIPDLIILPLGNGTLLIGAYKGFKELYDSGMAKKIPSFLAVQADSCSPVYKIFKENLNELPEMESGETLAEGISVAKPPRWRQIIKIIRETDGDVIKVNDEEILEGAFELARRGIYCEPTSATSISALKKYNFKGEKIVVVPLTGHGLKATENYLKFLEVYK